MQLIDQIKAKCGKHLSFKVYLAFCLGASALAIGIRLHLDTKVDETLAKIAALKYDQRPGTSTSESAEAPDFTKHLPATPNDADVMQFISTVAERHSVLVASIDSNQKIAEINTLGRTELNVNLKGSYPDVKTVIKETLNRYQHVVLKNLRVQGPKPPDTNVQASVLFLALTQAAQASPN